MFLQSFWKIKKAGCILLAVLILWMTPACDYLDARHMETVDAASIVAGVTAVSLLKVTAAAFGVVIAAGATAKAVDSFQEWLDENGDAESIATWNQAQAEAQSLALNAGFVGSVRNWLQGKLGSLNSGEIADVTVGAGQVITNGVPVENTELYSAFSAGVSLEKSDYFYFFHSSGISTVRGVLETGWTTLWGRLAGMGDTLTDIWETLTAGFSLVTAGITDIPGTLSGLFENLHEWIMDIPVTVSDAFTNLHDWIMDIPQTLTAGFDAVTDTLLSIPGWLSDLADAIPGVGEITLPITDAIADTLTVDPDAVQEAVAAESAELWDLPFLEQAQDLFDGLSFSAEVTYPKIKMVTPAIIRPYYDRPEIILLDFEDYKTYCQWMRLLLRAALWLAFVWHVVVLITPKLRIS